MNNDIGRLAADWWRGLQPTDEPGRRRQGDRAALARLRRASTLLPAASEAATVVLCRALSGQAADLERAALIAAVLAQVREDVRGAPVARQVGPRSDGHAAMSELRFRRLLQAATIDEQLTAFRRLVSLAGDALNIADLAESLWRWDEARRRRWIYAYYDAPELSRAALPTKTDAVASGTEDATP